MSTALKNDKQPMSVKELAAVVKRARTIPFTMSTEESDRLHLLAEEARERGDEAEWERISKQIPLSWEMAQTVIQYYGRAELMKMGWNLSYAVAVLGEHYVYGE